MPQTAVTSIAEAGPIRSPIEPLRIFTVPGARGDHVPSFRTGAPLNNIPLTLLRVGAERLVSRAPPTRFPGQMVTSTLDAGSLLTSMIWVPVLLATAWAETASVDADCAVLRSRPGPIKEKSKIP